MIGSAVELWRYPASSFGGERQAMLSVGEDGAAGDRLFGLVEEATGEPARPDREARWHKVPLVRARLSGAGTLEIALPGADWMPAPSAESDAALSAFMGFSVAPRPFGPDAAPGFAGPLTEPRYRKAPLHVLTTASLARLKALHPAAVPDPRRFRPSVLVEIGYLSYEKDAAVLTSAAGQKKIARALFERVRSYEKIYSASLR